MSEGEAPGPSVPGSGVVAVDPAVMSEAATFLGGLAQNLITALREVDADVDTLMGSWKSPAATAFAGGWDEARAGGLEVLDSLGEMAELLGVQGLDFSGTDADLSATVTSAGPGAPSSLSLVY
ncbi:WXG100 family type VII secretion target [Nocardia cyriacigeorgica]|uniref:WXG100 family type VII secretion target n=1 Tax=Nocardia cyriacigeorgica TaxID=135487 RepID=A0A6P1DHT5_9NOCA|nr:WXG100 family type VII secretion target [Nocardia cyriacigeorgica]NEW42504.1 WXG100 family type VII secretion target [Nocardia cyriacigeorgica]NEW48200.1 WXG100 family type VII secretion target [Nocardia cyriacigeorgica]